MKKLVALFLVFTILLSFSSCANKPNQTEKENSSDGQIQSESIEKREFSTGRVSGSVYENKFIGIGCELGEDWTFYTDEQIKEMNEIAADIVGEDFEKAIQNAKIVQDMFAQGKKNKLNNILVTMEKMEPDQLNDLDPVSYFKKQTQGLDQDTDFVNAVYETATVSIGGKAFDALHCTVEVFGTKTYMTFFGVKCNGYLATVSINTTSQAELDKLLSQFYLVK